jgi:tetratricopeptide (TPR) repeat protein
MPARGFGVATLAKRSYVYPHRRPRPGLDDFARDALALVEALKQRSVIGDERDLVIVGYSEGSIVASRLLGLLARPPAGCVLLGSATGAVDYATVGVANWPYSAAYRARGWSDERIAAEFERHRAFAAAIGTIDEATFEQAWKTDDRRGLAPWESYAVARDTRVYDPVPTLLRAKTPLLFCVGDRDTAMPLALVRGVYDRLAAGGGAVTLRVIDDEVHQYLKYDVFLVLDAWITSGGRTADFVPNEQDRAALARAAAVAALQQTVAALPWTGEADRAAASLAHARTLRLEDARAWFKLGMLMTDARRWDDALFAFETALASEPDAPHGSMTWAGHVTDLKGDRAAALAWYRRALEAYNGVPLRHDHLGITIDRAWIERRLAEPYTGPPGRQ